MKDKRPNYGIDAPPVIIGFFLSGFVGILFGWVIRQALIRHYPLAAKIVFGIILAASAYSFLNALLMVLSSKWGKVKLIKRLVANLGLTGSEHILDIGCGRGIVLVTVAKQLQSGKVTGIDLWKSYDQSRNSEKATLENVAIEGVHDKVAIKTADMQDLPFENNSFDVAVASLTIHNVKEEEGRTKTLEEMSRVIKPGGRVALVDFMHTGQYAAFFEQAGWTDVKHSRSIYSVFPPMRIVTAVKPQSA